MITWKESYRKNDDKYLITASKDGTLLMFEIKNRDERRSIDCYINFIKILVTKNDLEEMRA